MYGCRIRTKCPYVSCEIGPVYPISFSNVLRVRAATRHVTVTVTVALSVYQMAASESAQPRATPAASGLAASPARAPNSCAAT
jgi:hypothetical protein